MYIRRVITLLLIICMLASSLLPVIGQSTLDTTEKAAVLNKLGLISGDGKGNYNLNGSLKRYEAAVFIIKLLGKSDELDQNKDTLKYTSFTDVKSTSWYAPYVGYCQANKIISGVGSNKFGVDTNLTEQAFLSMVMTVLGYSSSEDFKWNSTVFKKAYEIGLVKDAQYLGKTKDNINYTRKEVVEIMYNALTLKLKGSNNTLIQQLIASGALEKDVVTSAGIIIDSMVTKINQVTPLGTKRLKIELNEVINSIDSNSIKIYESSIKDRTLDVAISSHSGSEIILDTSVQAENMLYTVEIDSAVDMDGNVTSNLSYNFTGYKIVALKSDLFRISLVEQVSRSEALVYFTQPVNENIEFTPSYTITSNGQTFASGEELSVSITGEKNIAAISLKSKVFTPGAEYELRISGELVGSYGIALGEGSGDKFEFIAKDMGESKLTLENVYAISSKAIKLSFNRKINPVLAQQIYNYAIIGSDNNQIQIEKAAVIDEPGLEQKAVIIRLQTILDKTKTYGLIINRINDITKQYSIEEQKYSFSGNYTNQTLLDINSTSVLDAYTLEVSFNKPIDIKIAMNMENYLLTDMSYGSKFYPTAVKLETGNQNTVKLFFKEADKLIVNRAYSIKLPSTFLDYSGESANNIIEKSFLVRAADSLSPHIKEAKLIGSNAIIINFDKEIASTVPNSSPQNYILDYVSNSISYKKYPIAISYIDDYSVVLLFDKLDKSLVYGIKYKSIADYGGNETVFEENQRIVIKVGE